MLCQTQPFPISCFLSRSWFCQKFSLWDTTTTTTGRTRDFFGRPSGEALLVKQEKPSSTCQSLLDSKLFLSELSWEAVGVSSLFYLKLSLVGIEIMKNTSSGITTIPSYLTLIYHLCLFRSRLVFGEELSIFLNSQTMARSRSIVSAWP